MVQLVAPTAADRRARSGFSRPSDGRVRAPVAFAPFRAGRPRLADPKSSWIWSSVWSSMGCRIRIVGGRDNEAQGEALARQIGEARNLCGKNRIPQAPVFAAEGHGSAGDRGFRSDALDALGVPLVAVFSAAVIAPGQTGNSTCVLAKSRVGLPGPAMRAPARGDLACLRTLDVETVFRPRLEAIMTKLFRIFADRAGRQDRQAAAYCCGAECIFHHLQRRNRIRVMRGGQPSGRSAHGIRPKRSNWFGR